MHAGEEPARAQALLNVLTPLHIRLDHLNDLVLLALIIVLFRDLRELSRRASLDLAYGYCLNQLDLAHWYDFRVGPIDRVLIRPVLLNSHRLGRLRLSARAFRRLHLRLRLLLLLGGDILALTIGPQVRCLLTALVFVHGLTSLARWALITRSDGFAVDAAPSGAFRHRSNRGATG